MRIGLARLAAFTACFVFASAAATQTYPTRQIRLVVPFAAGGPADLLARVIADEMSKDFGQQVYVDNRPGANTIAAACPNDGARRSHCPRRRSRRSRRN